MSDDRRRMLAALREWAGLAGAVFGSAPIESDGARVPRRDRDGNGFGVDVERASERGHYESWFLRANDPQRPRALWIRYTLFVPRRGDARRPVGELWAMYFDEGTTSASYASMPIDDARVADEGLSVHLGPHRLEAEGADGTAVGRIDGVGERALWDLRFTGAPSPTRLLPDWMFGLPLPRAKVLSSRPSVRVSGELRIGNRIIGIRDWIGSQNHNWGTRHTDEYAWAQVVGFDGRDDTTLECATARVSVLGRLLPPVTFGVLRHRGEEHRFQSLRRGVAAKTTLVRDGAPSYALTLDGRGARIDLRVSAPSRSFARLRYDDPSGTDKICWNTKVAAAELSIVRAGESPERLVSRDRAALELLTPALGATPRIVAADDTARPGETT